MGRRTRQDYDTKEEDGWKCSVCNKFRLWDEDQGCFNDVVWKQNEEVFCEECIENEEIRRNTNVLDYKNGLTEEDKIDYTDMVASLSAFNKLLNKKEEHTYDESVVLTLLADEVNDIRIKIQQQLFQSYEDDMILSRGPERRPDYEDWRQQKEAKEEKTKKRKKRSKIENTPMFAS